MTPQGGAANRWLRGTARPSARIAYSGLFLVTLRLALAAAWCGATPPATPHEVPPDFEDAELTAVCFVDAEQGWAVGDRGVIWHTADGGETWTLQPSGISCRLNTVHFLDHQRGWAAGGAAMPPGDLSRGVILSTRDGGRSWQAIPKLPLPAIRRIRFLDAQQGWCLGESSALFPAGLARTTDGGRSWDAMSGSGPRGWLTGDLLDLESGAVAGAAGTLAPVRRQGIESGKSPRPGLRDIHVLRLLRGGAGWLAGDAGLVLGTVDGGRSWQVPASELPPLAAQLDWRALATFDNQVWLAGTPGTVVLHSPDGGKSWQAQATGQALPIRALTFADAKHGWGVGALGTILSTRDGGRTWRVQRAGGKRAAWLALLSEPHDLPWELWGKLAASEGYLAAVEFVARRDAGEDATAEFFRGDRARQALTELGASSVETYWQFPLPARELAATSAQILAAWNEANDGQAGRLLEERLVRAIRTWRPEVIVTHSPFPRGDHPLEHMVNQAVLRATEGAADATRHPELINQLGLAAWQVKKVIGGPVAPTPETIRLHSAELAPRLSQSLVELAEMPRAILEPTSSRAPQEFAFRLYVDRVPQRAGAKDFFAGIILPPGGDARRRLSAPDPLAAERSRQLAARSRNLQSILARTSQGERGGMQVVGAIGGLVEGFDGPTAGRVLYRLAQDYVRQGQWDLAADTMNLLVQQYPQHPMTPAALVWLVRYGASSEIAWRLNRDERLVAEQISAGDGTPPAASPLSEDDDARAQPIQAAALVERANRIGVDHERTDGRREQAIAAAKRIEELDPARAREPSVVFPLACAYRGRGLQHDADRLLLLLKQGRPLDAWSTSVAAEQWLARPEGACPKPTIAVGRAATRPRLDGELDDALWQQAQRVDLTRGAGEDEPWPAAALFAYDAEFVYFSVSCRQATGVDYAPAATVRPRDPDLSKRDRVELLLDLDRDAATWFRLTVDAQGWTNDACCDDPSWNPQWYVAAATADGVWTIEAAIPLDQLTRTFPRARSAWGIGLQRIAPGAGFQSWTRPATPQIQPEGFGLLIFE